MTPQFPVIELFDRLAIAEVKWERTHNNQEELDWYTNQIVNYDFDSIIDIFKDLKTVHEQIWDLEAELKSGREHELPLDEIGRRAIAIRDHNHKRIAIKNHMAETLSCNVREIKKNHLSE